MAGTSAASEARGPEGPLAEPAEPARPREARITVAVGHIAAGSAPVLEAAAAAEQPSAEQVSIAVGDAAPASAPAAAEEPAGSRCPEKGPLQQGSRLLRAGRRARTLTKVTCLGLMAALLCAALVGWPAAVIDNPVVHRRVMSALFLVGLFLVAAEDALGINKSAVMLILAATMWVLTAVSHHPHTEAGNRELHHELAHGLEEVGGIILFLLPAMGVVESIDYYGGFEVVTYLIRRALEGRRERLMPIICFLCFFMSSVIDNLTATIVALKLLHHVAGGDDEWRRLCGGLAVVAANAGGAWSPIGDVTTTMLWIQGKISAPATVRALFLPSLAAGVLPLAPLMWQARRSGQAREPACKAPGAREPEAPEVSPASVAVLAIGVGCILLVPVLKMWAGLPPYLGMLLALGVVWVAADALAPGQERPPAAAAAAEGGRGAGPGSPSSGSSDASPEEPPAARGEHSRGVPEALHRVDLTGLLFFTGVLLAVVALDSAGVLRRYAEFLVGLCGRSPVALSSLLGVSSAVVDNVPLVEAAIGMFDNSLDDPLWQLVALAAGTGGSILSVGSIAGVTLMGMEGIGFVWYCRRISLPAALGFAAGIGVYQLQRLLLGLLQ